MVPPTAASEEGKKKKPSLREGEQADHLRQADETRGSLWSGFKNCTWLLAGRAASLRNARARPGNTNRLVRGGRFGTEAPSPFRSSLEANQALSWLDGQFDCEGEPPPPPHTHTHPVFIRLFQSALPNPKAARFMGSVVPKSCREPGLTTSPFQSVSEDRALQWDRPNRSASSKQT